MLIRPDACDAEYLIIYLRGPLKTDPPVDIEKPCAVVGSDEIAVLVISLRVYVPDPQAFQKYPALFRGEFRQV